MTQSFEKIFVLDTNIILNNAHNFITLADNGRNLIILPETVLDEIDSKKSGTEEINFQARSFARLLYDAEICENKLIYTPKTRKYFWQIWKPKPIKTIVTKVENSIIYMISKETYKADKESISRKIVNDRKILEITQDLQASPKYKKLKFISLDIMARTRAISLGIPAEALNLGKIDVDVERDFHTEITINDYNGDIDKIPEQSEEISSITVINEAGKPYIYFKSRAGWKLVPEKNPHRLAAPPINIRQKIMAELILDGDDKVIVTAGPAGTGKTLVALAAAMKIIDNNKDLYKKIYYIRRTIISGTKDDEVGFLPGTLEEKLSGYTAPLESSLRKLAQLKKGGQKQTKEELEDRIYDLKEKYDIEVLYDGHLRGDTLEDGSILISDEIQNYEVSSIRTIYSRLGKNSIILAMGSNNQIDTQYLTKNTNALTYLMDMCGKETKSGVRVEGVRLTNVMRSKLAEWADEELY